MNTVHDSSPPGGSAPLQALAACEARYEALFSRIPVMMHSIDAKGAILSVSDLWLEKLGYNREEVIGRPSTDFLTEQSKRHARDYALPLFFAQGYCHDIHYDMIAKNGDILHVLLSATAEYGPDGGIARSLAVLNDITPLKLVEQSLRESEERLAHAFRGSRDGVWDWNATTDKVYYSTAWCAMLGYDKQELSDSFSEWESRLHPDDRDAAFASIHAHLSGQAPYHEIVHRLRCKDGSYKWILSRGMVVSRDESGAPLRVIGTHTDMSEFKRIESELERSRSNLALAQRMAHIGSWEWDIAADSIIWSDETFHIFGVSRETFTPDFESYVAYVHPEDKERLLEVIKTAMAGNDTFNVEHRLYRADGDLRHVQALGLVQRDADGQAVSMAGTVQDVTERKQAEDALRASEAKFRAMTNATLDALIMIDAQDTIVFWSPSAERMFGYTRKEAQGQCMHELIVPEEYRADVAKGLQQFGRDGTGPVIGSLSELPAIHKDGSVFPVERSVSAFTSEGKWFAVGMLRDVTQRKKDEQRLIELATTDSLTGLANRRHFLELAEQARRHSQRYADPLSLLVFDIDHFKRVNDTYGHDAGDAVLRTLAQTFRQTLREVDIVGRMGGEEFAACLPQTDLESALQAAERLRKAVSQAGVAIDGSETLYVTISIGVAYYETKDESLDELLKRADQALYEAKNSGRNRVVAH